ncbi:hypothetical protein EW145_g1984 [Phellinidium pouzarii]|uniref:Rhomboid-type serine protease n=1 Tax=Phellinidium pouzarii TaxID=167371 RepID=A0A4S4LCF5_9AGAM|nr:hypothetical protein EW145_g1984 [Phellinidium pouzarii]
MASNVRDDLPRVSVDSIQYWQRIKENFNSAAFATLESKLVQHGLGNQRHILFPHLKQFVERTFEIAKPNLRINGRNFDEYNEDEQDTDQFDESLDRRVWSLSDQRLKWDLEIAVKRRSIPLEVEALMRDLISHQREYDARKVPDHDADKDIDMDTVEDRILQGDMEAVNSELSEFAADLQETSFLRRYLNNLRGSTAQDKLTERYVTSASKLRENGTLNSVLQIHVILMAIRSVKNVVASISKPSALILLSPNEISDWCEQVDISYKFFGSLLIIESLTIKYAQEGYDVYQISYPIKDSGPGDTIRRVATELNRNKAPFAIITYGLPAEDAKTFYSSVQFLIDLGLKACIHYAPILEDGNDLLIVDLEGKYIPVLFHVACSQEKLHASLLPRTDPANLPYNLKPSEFPPIAIHAYPFVSATPAFPLLAKAPASVVPGQHTQIDPYVLSATNLAYTKTLELLRREIGPRLDLEKIWGQHLYYVGEERRTEDNVYNGGKGCLESCTYLQISFSIKVKVPYVNHIPTMTGGVGYEELARFYRHHFTNETITPPDSEIITVSRTIGADRIIDEMIFKCTHTTEIDYFLPGVKPTGKPLELALVGVVAFRGDKLFFEHLYWDQASALVQLGLLDPTNLPIAGREVVEKVLNPFGTPSNTLMSNNYNDRRPGRVWPSQPTVAGAARTALFLRSFDMMTPYQSDLSGHPPYTPHNFNSYETTNANTSDTSSTITRATSGILASDASGKKNDYGETEAEEVANSYLSTPSNYTSSRVKNGFGGSQSISSQNQESYYAQSNMDTLAGASVDENLHSSIKALRADDNDSLVGNAADTGRLDKGGSMGELEYQDPYNSEALVTQPPRESAFARFFSGKYPIEQRIEDKERGIGRQRYPFLVWLLTTIMVAVFIYELVVNGQQQGSPISLKPVVNYMLGPSESALIDVGARFPPCMKDVLDVPITLELPCMNDTANPPTEVCPISELCGFGGIDSNETPNQWFRFITAIFLHAGIIHIALNMVAQLLVSAQLEREMGSVGFFLVYFCAGIFGNVLGGNFALVGVPSVGASGAIFGTVAVSWVDLLAHWKYQYRPKAKLIAMTIELILGIAMGFIPYVDNFAHLGGFLMGLLVGTIFYPVISETKRHRTVMWGLRLAALPLVIVLFVVLTRNFYTTDPSACEFAKLRWSPAFYTFCSLQLVSLSFLHSDQRKQSLQRHGNHDDDESTYAFAVTNGLAT